MKGLKSFLGMNVVWWLIMIILIGVLSVLLWIVTGENIDSDTDSTQTTQETVVEENDTDELDVEESSIDDVQLEEDATTGARVLFWPDFTIDESLTEEGSDILQTAQAYLSEVDTGYWSYVFEKYNPPFALVTVEDDENGPDFNFEVILKEIDGTWQVIYQASTVFETPPQDIIDQYGLPTVVSN